MNKSAFLDVLNHVSSISEQEVAELEKLVLSFPYCQTAHSLLAKAAYDQGSMLSNQRLRRAAACATNRQLLKKLIYTAGTNIAVEPISQTEPEIVASGLTQEEINTADNIDENNIVAEPVEIIVAEPVSEIIQEPEYILTDEPSSNILTDVPEASEILPETNGNSFEELDSLFLVEHLAPAISLQDPVTEFISNLTVNADAPTGLSDDEQESGNIVLSHSENQLNNEIVISDFAAELNAGELTAASEPLINELESPAIAEPEDDTLERFDEYLFKPEKEIASDAAKLASYQEEIIYKIFDANDLGYWMDSSRLGESLSLKNDLTTSKPYYFHPELFLEYSKHHEIASYSPQPQSILTRQLDIIDQFLKLNPKIKSMTNIRIKQDSQEDLSSKSTKIKKNIASETLANIMVQQGKIKKAIKIYEHLILKIPEKKAYFASQIEKLNNIS